MRKWQAVAAAVMAGMTSAAFAAGPDVRGLTRWTTPALTIFANDDEKVRAVVRSSSFAEQILFKLLKREPRPNGIPTYVLIPRGSVWNKYLKPGDRLVSEYVPTRFANYVLISNWLRDEQVYGAAYHEFTHVFLRNQFAGHVPLWFDDGLAGLVANWSEEGNAVRIGEKTWAAQDLQLPTSQLLRVERHSPLYQSRRTSSFHWHSKVFVHKALLGDVDFGRRTFAYLAALNEGLDIDSAIQRSFGHGVDELHDSLNDYSNKFYLNVTDLQIEWQAPLPPVRDHVLDDFEGLELLAQVMLDTGVNPMRVEEVVAAAARLQPESPRVLVLQLRLAARDQNDAAIESLLSRLEPLSKDPTVSRRVGIALFERVHEPTPDHALTAEAQARLELRALEHLLVSERNLPMDPEAAWALGHLAARLGRETGLALQRLELAHEALPRSADITEATALVLKRMGEPEAMVVRLRDTLKHARTVRQIVWAKEQLTAAGFPP